MRTVTTVLTVITLLFVGGWNSNALAQSELVVDWRDADGFIQPDALLDAIEEDQANDPPDDRVYVLEADGFYTLTSRIAANDFDLRIVGEEPGDGELPPIIQPAHDEDGNWDETIIETEQDLELRNVWIITRTNQGNFGWDPINMVGADTETIIDNIVVEFGFGVFMHARDAGQNISITNSHFRNVIDHDQYWGGRVLRTEAPTERIFFENNTVFNFGHTTIQATDPEGELWFNHNTVVNTGRSVIDGNQWQNAYISNNLFVNGFWHGETDEDFSAARQQEEDNQFGSWISIDDLDPALGFEEDRIIGVLNNVTWVAPEVDEYYTHYPEDIGEETGGPGDYEATGEVRAAAFLNIRAENFMNEYDNMIWDNHLDLGTGDLGLQFYEDGHFTDFSQDMLDWVDIQRRDTFEEPPNFWWEIDGRSISGENLIQNVDMVYPIPENAENFTYTDSEALSNAVGGYPAGDLNWFPDEKADWEAERDNLEEQIRDRFEEPEDFMNVAELEAEDGALSGDASIMEYDGYAHFHLETGEIVWNFNLDEGGEYGIDVHHNKGDEGDRGQDIIVNDVALQNEEDYGEYFFPGDQPQNQWLVEEIRNHDLYEGEIAMNEGENEIRIGAAWGFQHFRGVDIVDENGDVVLELGMFDADSFSGGQLTCETELSGVPGENADDFCPSGGAWVDYGSGGTIEWDFDAPGTGDYLVQFYYVLDEGSGQTQGDFEVDGMTTETINFEDDSGEMEVVVSSLTNFDEGINEIALENAEGGLQLDRLQFFTTEDVVTSIRDERKADRPRGIELKQNYPNPFNPTTNIEFELAQSSDITLTVYDTLGRRITTLAEGQYQAGQHLIQFDASSLASGVYIYRLEAGDASITRQMLFIK